MKPIKLVLEAFGSFLEKTTIDFECLNAAPIYLITGPTGVGKTTIFDAISFALYGKASGERRVQEDFRSQYASLEETYVELTFSEQGKIYKIKRSPKYQKPQNKSITPQSVELILPSGEALNKVGEVDDKIKEIIHLDAEQFKKVAMLAQGEFFKFILASSQEKQKILSDIFGLDFFTKTILKLKDKTLKEKQVLGDLEQSLNNLISNYNELGFSTTSILELDLKGIASTIKTQELVLNEKSASFEKEGLNNKKIANAIFDAKKINEDIEEKEKALKSLSSLEEKRCEYKALEKTLNELKLSLSYQSVVTDYNNIKAEVALANKYYLQEEEKYNSLAQEQEFYLEQEENIKFDEELKDNKQKEVELYSKQIDKQKKIDSVLESINNNQIKLEVLDKTIINLNTSLESLNKEIAINDENLNLLKSLEEKLEKNNLLKDDYASLDASYEKEATQKELLEEKVGCAKEKEVERKHAFSMYINHLSSSLAKDLQDGEACPVCGSTEHPHLAEEQSAISEAEYEKIVEDANLATKELENASSTYSQILLEIKKYEEKLGLDRNSFKDAYLKFYEDIKATEQDIASLNKKVVDKYTLLNKKEDLEKEIVKCEKEAHGLKEIIKTYEKDIEALKGDDYLGLSLDDLTEKYEDAKATYEAYDEAITSYYQEKAISVKSFEESKSRLASLRADLEKKQKVFNSAEVLFNEALSKVPNLLENLAQVEQIANLSASLSSYNESLKQAKSNLALLEEKTQNKTLIDISKLDDELKNSDALLNALNSEIKELEVKIKYAKKHLASLRTVSKDYLNAKEEYYNLKALYDLVTGNNIDKITLEGYILQVYFQEIISYANIRLANFSSRRYQLVKKESLAKGGAKSGLDFSIFDYETGKMRDASTLSGGETFIASLSLALGLSDAILNEASGCSLDAIFIDEGFGSLDDEALNNALNILKGIGSSSKQVAIISHVAALKEAIPYQIIVSKAKIGSKLEVKEN